MDVGSGCQLNAGVTEPIPNDFNIDPLLKKEGRACMASVVEAALADTSQIERSMPLLIIPAR
jgi:hypothetical protein